MSFLLGKEEVMKVAFILRGVPGSGKSRLAKLLARNDGVIHSTDNFFYVNGEYKFDPAKLSEYHNRNFAAFCKSLREGVPAVVCDNTNAKHWHYERYAVAAEKAGYTVIIHSLKHPRPEDAARRNIHDVPESAIRRIIAEWED